MKRRAFIKAFAGAVASVSIGLKLSQGMPELKIITGIEDMENGEVLRFKATERFSQPWVDWRGAYGSPSVIDVRVDNP